MNCHENHQAAKFFECHVATYPARAREITFLSTHVQPRLREPTLHLQLRKPPFGWLQPVPLVIDSPLIALDDVEGIDHPTLPTRVLLAPV